MAASALPGLWAAGAICIAISLGIQLLLSACLISSWITNQTSIAAKLTIAGKMRVLPEHDLEIFASGVVLTLILMVTLIWWWNQKLSKARTANSSWVSYAGSWLAIVAVAGLTACGLLYSAIRTMDIAEYSKAMLAIILLLPALLTALLATIGGGIGAARLKRAASQTGIRRWWLDFLVVGGIGLVVYVPTYQWQAGYVVWADASHHWDHFVMGPAVG
jgi:hypothetical protein